MFARFFGPPCTFDIELDSSPTTKFGHLCKDKKDVRYPIFTNENDVSGSVTINVKSGKVMEHQGVRVELVGKVEFPLNESASYEFFNIHHDLQTHGTLSDSKKFAFKFSKVDLSMETYWGVNVRLRYFVRVRVLRGYQGDESAEKDFIVQNPNNPPDINNSIKMEVGIDGYLHLEFMWDKSKYHLKDVIRGKVFFGMLKLRFKHMELHILRKESAGTGNNQTVDTETVAKFEIMDGQPSEKECIPVRMYTSGMDLTPTYSRVLNKFSVRYFLNLVLVDEQDCKFFKQQEVTFWRKKIGQ